MSLEAYKERVERLARERSGEPIYNGTIEHASIIIEVMFASANRSIDLLTGKLNARVYGTQEVVESAALCFADMTRHMRVLIEQPDEKELAENPLYLSLSNNENVEFRAVPREVHDIYDFHFLVMDNDSYRFESDKKKASAVAAFGDAEGAANITRIFESLWGVGQPIERIAN